MRPRGYIADWKPYSKTRIIIDWVQAILIEYAEYLPLTLRQVFYRLVGIHGYDKDERAYKNLGELLNKMRRARLMRFEDIRDDSIVEEGDDGWDGLAAFGRTVNYWTKNYRLKRQIGQPVYQIIVTETAGIVPQLARIASPRGIPVTSSGGFNSTTDKWKMAKRIAELQAADDERIVRILHLGDLDEDGEHVHSNYGDDVAAFLVEDGDLERFRFERLAVTEAQVERLELPTQNTAKHRRSYDGIAGNPNATVQLEAIAPDELARIVTAAIEENWDNTASAVIERRERADRRKLAAWLQTLPPG